MRASPARAPRLHSFELSVRPLETRIRAIVLGVSSLAATVMLACGDDATAGGSGGAPAQAGASSGGMADGRAGAPAMSGGAPLGGAAAAAGTPSNAGAPGGGSAGGAAAGNGGGPIASGGRGGASGTSGAGGSSGASSASGASGASGAGGSTHTGVWRIMPLGDSITDTTCYPKLLSKRLKDGGKTNFEFIGTRTNNQSCNDAPHVKTEGHGGYLVTYLVDNSNASGKGSLMELEQWVAMATPPPDVVLMHFGTNDVWNGVPPATITSAYSFVLDKFRAKNPSLVVFAAKILPMHPNGCVESTPSCENNRVKALNAALPDWAAQASTATSPIHVVDVYGSVDAAAFSPNSALTMDGVHPNVTASDQMAKAWYDALVAKGIP